MALSRDWVYIVMILDSGGGACKHNHACKVVGTESLYWAATGERESWSGESFSSAFTVSDLAKKSADSLA